jgi:hypothetical protein
MSAAPEVDTSSAGHIRMIGFFREAAVIVCMYPARLSLPITDLSERPESGLPYVALIVLIENSLNGE